MCSRFLSHSKYEHVTPPPLTKRSGAQIMPLLKKIYSAAKVVGPLAPSKIAFTFIFSAFTL